MQVIGYLVMALLLLALGSNAAEVFLRPTPQDTRPHYAILESDKCPDQGSELKSRKDARGAKKGQKYVTGHERKMRDGVYERVLERGAIKHLIIIPLGNVVTCGYHEIIRVQDGYLALLGSREFQLDRRGRVK